VPGTCTGGTAVTNQGMCYKICALHNGNFECLLTEITSVQSLL
jgi:hypothetical protein